MGAFPKYKPTNRNPYIGELVQHAITLHVWPVLEVTENGTIWVQEFEGGDIGILKLNKDEYYVLEKHEVDIDWYSYVDERGY